MAKKDKSPSTLRRNLKRKEDFLKKKSSEATKETSEEEVPIQKKSFECDQYDQVFNSERGLKIHTGKTHKVEILREKTARNLPHSLPGSVSAVVTPCHQTTSVHQMKKQMKRSQMKNQLL